MKLINLFLILSCFYSCTTKNVNTYEMLESIHVIDFDTLKMISKFHLSEAVYSSSFIIPELTDQSMFSFVDKLEVADSLIYILDTYKAKAVFVYGMDGRFLRKIGSIGQGPGEYLNISDFSIDKKGGNICLFDCNKQKINVYDIHTGKYKSANYIKIESNVEYIDNNLYVSSYYYKQPDPDFLLFKLDQKDFFIEESYFSAKKYNKGSYAADYGGRSEFYNTPNGVRFIKNLSDTIVTVDSKGIWPFLTLRSKNLLTVNDVKSKMTFSHDSRELNQGFMIQSVFTNMNKIYNIDEYIEFGDYIIFYITIDNGKNDVTRIVYNMKSKQSRLFNFVYDDVTFKKIGYQPSINFVYADSTAVYAYFHQEEIDRLLFCINEGCTEEFKTKNKISTITEKSNPILIRYEYF